MFALSRRLTLGQIADIQRLDPQERQQSRERFEQFINRGRVEAARLDNLPLERINEGNQDAWRYRGEWFTLESHTSEALTRLFVTRLEQLFTAFLRVLPPRTSRQGELRVVVFGASESYQALARSLGAPVQNAAFYHPARNLVAAGSDLARLSAQLRQIQSQHDALRTELERLRKELPQRLERRRAQLAAATISESDRRKSMSSYSSQLNKEISAREKKLQEYDRANEAAFQQHAGRTLALLRHEAFHAYLENYVYPQSRHDVPRWLNEGLAQVFENGVLEADTFRVDLLSKSVLSQLEADFASQSTTLAKVLAADHRSFLVPHDADVASKIHYAYAWALAHYLAFVRPVLGSRALDEYVAAEAADQQPVARFERLVDQPLSEFEAQWRQWVISQKTDKR
jgi:hypothetical protein